MSAHPIRAAALLGVLAVAVPACAGAQAGQGGLAARVAAAPDGEVWMRFASRPGVCGSENGFNISSGSGSRTARSGGDGGWSCVEGPVWVALVRRGGRVERVRTRVARGWSGAEGAGRVTDLGMVGARAASEYLLALAERATAGRVGEEAIVPATLADSVTTWPALLRMARNDALPEQTRRSSVFWLSQQAGDRITRELSAFVSDGDENRELRKHAVFALSQRPRDEAVPELVRIARTHRDPEIRKSAMFWLGQSGDPRAVALFEQILRN
ncbi:MAG TPA: HEAT repeat domain-containing protein [Longimicrobium sp.]|nr:HEAT repeat domain-containing protein [Longimicrobium sp.]